MSAEINQPATQREVSCRVTKSILRYLELAGYDVSQVIAGLPFTREYLCNPVNWINYEYRTEICRRAAEITHNPEIMYSVGLAAPELNSLGGMEPIIRLLAGPRQAYRLVNRYSGFFDKGFSLTTRFLGRRHLRVTMKAVKPYAVSRYSCQYARGVLAAIPKMWNLPPAEISENACIFWKKDASGQTGESDACIFDVRWQSFSRWYSWITESFSFRRTNRPVTLRQMENEFFQIDTENSELRMRHVQLSQIREMALELDSARTRDQIFHIVIEKVRDIPGVRFVAYGCLDESQQNILVPYYSRFRNETVLKTLKAVGIDLLALLGQDSSRGTFTFPLNQSRLITEFLSNSSIRTIFSLSEMLEGVLPHSLVDIIQKATSVVQITLVPIIVDGRSMGSVVVFQTAEVAEDLLAMVGAHCAIALKNARNLSDLEKSNTELKESEKFLRVMLESIRTGIVIIDPVSHTLVDVNPYACELIGEKKENLVGKVCHRFICPTEVGACPVTDKGQNMDVAERTLCTAGGSCISILKSVVAIQRGGRRYLIESFSDIEPLKKARAALEESEKRYRRLSENAADIVSRLELSPLRFTYISPSVEKLTGYTPTEVYLLDPREIIHPQDYEVIRHPPQQESWQMNIRLKHKSGHYITLEQKNVPLFDAQKNLEAVESISRDISERLNAQKALSDSEQRYRTIFNSTNDILLLIDLQGRLIDINQRIRIIGYEPEAVIGMNILDIPSILSPESTDKVIANFHRRLRGEDVEAYELELISRDNRRLIFEVNSNALFQDGRPIGFLAVLRDITERRIAQQKIQSLYEQEKAQRMELEEEAKARAMFIDILAHELRTPLTPMMITSAMLDDLARDGLELRYQKLTRMLSTSVINLAARLEELLEVARYARGTFKLNPQNVDVREFINDLMSRSRMVFELNQQHLAVRMPVDIGWGFFDPSRIEQVISNLLSNAAKFSPLGSLVEVLVERHGNQLHIEVRDQGTGISEENQKLLFQPYHRFQQDRSVYPGTGLGLAVCKQIIEAHHGKIWYRREAETGSIFGFDIPLNHTSD